MDANKLNKLREIGYEIRECCGCCTDGNFEKGSLWGTCSFHKYDHLKHTDSKRNLSVFLFGHCGNFVFDGKAESNLDHFEEFI